MANDMIRMSGMNSGLDTESIIEALTANSKLKITKQERSLLKYKAVQEGYRDVISKLQNLKSSYFDILKKNSNLSGTSMWSKYAAKTIVNGTEQNLAGVSIATSINSAAGDYKIKVVKTATQSTVKGASLSDGAKVRLNDDFAEDQEYGMTVSVGDVEKNITFRGGATAAETRQNINRALRDAYGESNDSAGGAERGMVYVDESGKFISRAGKGISISGAGSMNDTSSLDMSNVATGNNALTFQVGDETVNVTFQTLASDYFSDIFDEDGNIKDDADADKKALYEQVKDDYVESKKYDAYKSWEALATDGDKQALKSAAFAKAEEEQRVKYVGKFLDKKYDEYKAGLAEGEEAQEFDDWKAANFVDVKEAYETYKSGLSDPSAAESFEDWKTTNGNALYSEFEDYYYDHDVTPSTDELQMYDDAMHGLTFHHYEAYKLEALANGTAEEDILSQEDWSARALDENDELYDAEYKSTADSYHKKYFTYTGYNLDETTWTGAQYNEYSAYKDQICTVDEAGLNIQESDIVTHYNNTSLKNSIGSLETRNGVKFSVDVDNGYEVKAKDGEGNELTFSMVSAAGSTNSFGAAAATVSISQISNSTKLSDLGVELGADNKYSFSINGKSFSFDADTTVKDMMKKVNGSDAGVKMTYSSLDNAFTITSNAYGTASKVDISDNDGLLSSMGLMAGAIRNPGENLVVEINNKTYESDSNSIEADGTTFTFTAAAEGADFTASISKDTSAIMDVIKNFVDDYNKIIKEVYEYLDEKPEKDYYFLADADKEQLDLSEKEEEKWEKKAKAGILYHDSTISSAMTKLRTALMGSVTNSNGDVFSLSSIGIKTSSDYHDHGKLVIDEDALRTAIENHSDDVAKLFSGDDGVMKKFSEALEGAIGTSGKNKGTLILKAGLATGSTAMDNQLYERMKSISKKITTLTKRYENEQDRLWKKYSAMESMLGTMNSQSASITSFFQQ